MNLSPGFLQYIKQQELFTNNDQLLLAVSGGVDSTVLCHLCVAAGFTFSIAHCNFQLRGAESDGDENFVKELAHGLGVNFFSKKFDTKAFKEEHKIGTQEAARELRYAWFAELISTHTLKEPQQNIYLLTAHHSSDNAETIVYNFLRGTGVKGLTGIPPKRDFIRRPLLFTNKKQVVDYAGENNISFREDASNNTTDYSRNFIRNQILPEVEKLFPNVQQNINDTAARFTDIQELYEETIAQKIKKLTESKAGEIHIPILKLQKTTGRITVLHELIQPFGFTQGQEEEIWKLSERESGKYIESKTHRILKNRNWLIISTLQNEESTIFVIEKENSIIIFPQGQLNVTATKPPETLETNPNIAMLDSNGIAFPVILRHWKQGDYFYPLGMQKKKKLSRFFIDQKLSLLQKEKTWVLESDKKIFWVVGQRIDDRYKIKPATKNALLITFLPAE